MTRKSAGTLEILYSADGALRRPTPTYRQLPADRRDRASRDRLLRSVRAEFVSMPGLLLSVRQAQRLFDVREDVCRRVLATLESEGLLCRDSSGRYATRSAAAAC
jgi:hypothetical protein